MAVLTDKQARDLVKSSRTIYAVAIRETLDFCKRHGMPPQEDGARLLVVLLESVAFGLIANHVEPEKHNEVVNSLVGGLRANLAGYREQKAKSEVRYDA